jgi:hypothetical protein
MLSQFYLELPLTGAGTPGEYIQNQGNTVDYLYLEAFFQVMLLQWRELIIDDYHVVTGGTLY